MFVENEEQFWYECVFQKKGPEMVPIGHGV